MEKFKFNLRYFDGTPNTNLTTSEGLIEEMKVYYSDYLIDNAEPELVHDQFAQRHPIPSNGGKTVQFRKYSPLPKLHDKPLAEGVTPNGQSLNMSIVEATVVQYGGYIELSDMLLLTAIDNNLVQATRLLGSQAGRTLDTVTREVLASCNSVQWAENQVKATDALVGGKDSGNHYLTVNAVRMAVRTLKKMNARKIDGSFVAIIHPDCSYDLMSDPNWKYPHQYQDTTNIYEGEIGKIEGVRFVETSEAKIFEGAGASGRNVYATFVLGADAYGTTEIKNGGLEHIVKQLGSAGTADPLNQRATAGWKATKAAVLLAQEHMVKILTTASAED